jgi:hypothetical protein
MTVRPGELRAGDVLLLRSAGPLAWAIRSFDGAEVDRAALFLGEGRVVEVLEGAPAVCSVEECLASAEHAVARRLKDAAPMEPVLVRARALPASTHATGRPEALLALLAASRKLRAVPSLRAVQRACLEAGAAALREPSPLVGPQFVWRCYEDALPEPSDVYTLHLNDLHNMEVVGGVPVVPGAGVARRLGRGVHPESLLAWAAQPLLRSRLVTPAAAEPGPPLEEALQRYEREAREDAHAAQPARAEADALLGSLQRFAGAWSGASPALARGPLPPQLEMLFRGAADLCTAGDLLRCENLFTI